MYIRTERGWRPLFTRDNEGNSIRLTDTGCMRVIPAPRDPTLLDQEGVGRRLIPEEWAQYLEWDSRNQRISPTTWLRSRYGKIT